MVRGNNYKDGRTGTRLYNIWRDMHKRCDDLMNMKYGGRGISVCRSWRKFENFREWAMSHGYADDLTIERNDNNKNYTPNNCSWIPKKQQARNRRNTHWITYRGETKSLAAWCEELNMNYAKVNARLTKLGWTPERAFEWVG